jgi:hypothetical protein
VVRCTLAIDASRKQLWLPLDTHVNISVSRISRSLGVPILSELSINQSVCPKRITAAARSLDGSSIEAHCVIETLVMPVTGPDQAGWLVLVRQSSLLPSIHHNKSPSTTLNSI